MPHNNLCPVLHADLTTLATARRIALPRRRSLFCTGARAHELYLVLSGVITRERMVGSGTCVLQIAGPQSLVGEEALTGEPMYASTATALTKAEVLAVPVAAFLQLCESHPQHWRSLTQWILGERTVLENRVQHLCHSPVRERLLQAFAELAGMHTMDNEDVTISVSQSEIASYIGATRETTSTVLNQLARQGIVSLHHRQIRVLRHVPLATAAAAAVA
jgi:CRP/FNR family transcriptional regulator, cyclic AMP receptor protein